MLQGPNRQPRNVACAWWPRSRNDLPQLDLELVRQLVSRRELTGSARADLACDYGGRTVNFDDLVQSVYALLNGLVIRPLSRFFLGLNGSDGRALFVLLAAAVALGFVIGRRRTFRTGGRRHIGALGFPRFQNSGEALVSRVLLSHFGPPDYHLMNHVTIRMDDGTTEVDHILVSRFGVFVIETKDYSGWIFANATEPTWTQVLFRRKVKFQNPILQNKRHVRAVRGLLDFLPPEAIKSVVVFSGEAEFKTDAPQGVITVGQLAKYLNHQTEEVMSLDRLQLCVGRVETARLAISRETDVEHIQSLARRHSSARRALGTRRWVSRS